MGWFSTVVATFRGESPLAEARTQFEEMLALAQEMLRDGDDVFWAGRSQERQQSLYRRDVRVNKLERSIRERIIYFLAGTEPAASLPLALSLMSLVKDVERLGDYAKNFAELGDVAEAPLPPSPERDRLRAISERVSSLSDGTLPVVRADDPVGARRLYEEGKALCKDCDRLVREVADSDAAASDAVRLAVGARYYKRVAAHLMNVLSSLLMPLHKLDFYDETYLETG